MYPLPEPREPSKCRLYCCFYAEFDNKVGPTICFQSPKNFMSQPIGVPTEKVQAILEQTFAELQSQQSSVGKESVKRRDGSPVQQSSVGKESVKRRDGSPVEATVEKSPSPATNSLSIFDSCSDYIITGKELTGNVINLSTHEIHLLTHPTVIVDDAYERNALLFSVGFILRRSSDPRLFQPIVSKLAQSFRELELENQYLTNPATRSNIQSLMEQLLVSLNSRSLECNLFMSKAHVLHLKLFHPPRTPEIPVPDFAVPVLLLRDWRHCQAYYDWDLSIDWCARHIDGVRNARQISEKAEVDMEIVRACLRVLKHHRVIALSDMFFYSNRYEATELAIAMLAGEESELLSGAVEYAIRSAEKAPSPLEGSPCLQPMALSPGTEGSIAGARAADRPLVHQSSARLLQPTSDFFLSSARREDGSNLKLAVAEFYSRCERKSSFRDQWVSLVCGSADDVVDWKRAFRLLDHRRLASFGVVHGLIRRIHKFPRVHGRAQEEASAKDATNNGPPPSTPSSAERKSLSSRHLQRFGSSTVSSSGGFSRKRLSAGAIVAKMDGRHCDDELACEFNSSLEELIKFVGSSDVSITLAPAHFS